jgi:hypothetical protein
MEHACLWIRKRGFEPCPVLGGNDQRKTVSCAQSANDITTHLLANIISSIDDTGIVLNWPLHQVSNPSGETSGETLESDTRSKPRKDATIKLIISTHPHPRFRDERQLAKYHD